jgi:hypothetical protein
MDSVSIGKDGHSVPIMTMANLGDAVWKKSACFDNLATTLNGQKGHHSVQELIAAMSSVLPVGTETAYPTHLLHWKKLTCGQWIR